jgi:nicotinamidase/pyrazinamidase
MMARYDSRTALIVVDVQNDFADPAGALAVPGGEAVVDVANAEAEAARRAGALVVYTQDWHPERTPHFASDGGVWPAHCVRDTWGAQFHPRLAVAGEVLRKGTGGEDGYSAFTVRDPQTSATSATRLERMLREHGVERIVIVGLATDYCVRETALDARRLGFGVTVLRAGVRGVNLQPGDDERALHDMEAAGARIE